MELDNKFIKPISNTANRILPNNNESRFILTGTKLSSNLIDTKFSRKDKKEKQRKITSTLFSSK